MVHKITQALFLAGVMLLGISGLATAATLFTFNGNCAGTDCFGSTYTLIIGDANDAVANTYTASLSINTSGYNGSITPPVFIDAVDFKVVNSLVNNTFALTGAPGGVAGWTTSFNSGQSATNCGSGGGFFICTFDTGDNSLAPVSGPQPLVWDFTFTSDDAITFGHIGASYNNALGTINGQNTSISSASSGTPGGSPGGTPGGKIPEPSALILLGSGLLVIGGLARRFSRKK